jgi:hypothetical protein
MGQLDSTSPAPPLVLVLRTQRNLGEARKPPERPVREVSPRESPQEHGGRARGTSLAALGARVLSGVIHLTLCSGTRCII